MILSLLATIFMYTPSPHYADEEFALVCNKLDREYVISCGDLQSPLVVYTNLVGNMGAIGLWVHGEHVVFIDPDSRVPFKQVIIHETIHYTLWHLNLIRSKCVSEEYARNWTAELTDTEVDPKWWKKYGCEKS